MIQIDNTLISNDLVNKKFVCDLQKCKGACCVLGNSGAPLEKNEIMILKKIFPELKPFLRPEGIMAIKKQGVSVIDEENENVTPLIEGKECAYTVFEDGIARCAIEKAFYAGVVNFRKPISCFLYPVRIKKYKSFEAVNYDLWEICDEARILGQSANVAVYQFTSKALIQKYGEEWYKKLDDAASEISNVNRQKK
jgi:hypothetical protein